ncbi:MAG: DUF5522 domain-containing protein [Acidobacteriota bacterium]
MNRHEVKKSIPANPIATLELIEGADFYFEGRFMIFTSAYLLKRGSCCDANCRHCPYQVKSKK